MRFQLMAIAAAFVCRAAAIPLQPYSPELHAVAVKGRANSDESDELQDGPCKKTTFIFARGSLEPGNMGFVVSPQVCADLKTTLGADAVACQGVGPPYNATIADNFDPQNTSPTDIKAATDLFDLANTKCPDTKIIAGGYSQGTAVLDGSIQALPASIKAKVTGVVLFGFTRNKQDGGRIPNYPTNQTKIFCASGDIVCDGELIITPAHLGYGSDAAAAASFLVSSLN
ncbi:uncharacterized protein TRUGW13939_00781 [Talaromyces rugulosus]|uniref:Cutinase n=1 Tax=Talaromyces rugulosus TaxID=121627 RepID=A0A7H8QJH7_TALRU|nr:uncharacterized protein TRUGW13939_00781 [Talaromyces rugulosus]QKX53701.1 hypothetical protein TRUGW13939_00781 [Talaromyces rugulosus]